MHFSNEARKQSDSLMRSAQCTSLFPFPAWVFALRHYNRACLSMKGVDVALVASVSESRASWEARIHKMSHGKRLRCCTTKISFHFKSLRKTFPFEISFDFCLSCVLLWACVFAVRCRKKEKPLVSSQFHDKRKSWHEEGLETRRNLAGISCKTLLLQCSHTSAHVTFGLSDFYIGHTLFCEHTVGLKACP